MTDVRLSVFDSIFPAAALCITRSGLLYAAAEFGDHALFQFKGLGEDSDCVAAAVHDPELGDDARSAASVAPSFVPASPPRNLLVLDEPESLAAITDVYVGDLADEGSPQVYALCGRGPRSSCRVLRHGVAVSEMAVSELPGRPSAVWTVRRSHDEPYDRYIVVSFTNATLVLSIGETVEEVTDSGFLATAPTLDVALLADGALLQVHADGIRHVRADARINEWKTPGKKKIERAFGRRGIPPPVSGYPFECFRFYLPRRRIELASRGFVGNVRSSAPRSSPTTGETSPKGWFRQRSSPTVSRILLGFRFRPRPTNGRWPSRSRGLWRMTYRRMILCGVVSTIVWGGVRPGARV